MLLLSIPEVLSEVFSHLDPYLHESFAAILPERHILQTDRSALSTLALSARVCRSFAEAALDVLWSTVSDLGTVLSLIDHLSLGTNDSIPESDNTIVPGSPRWRWHRFRWYSSRVLSPTTRFSLVSATSLATWIIALPKTLCAQFMVPPTLRTLAVRLYSGAIAPRVPSQTTKTNCASTLQQATALDADTDDKGLPEDVSAMLAGCHLPPVSALSLALRLGGRSPCALALQSARAAVSPSAAALTRIALRLPGCAITNDGGGPRTGAPAFAPLVAPLLAGGLPHVAAFECMVPRRWVAFGDADLEALARAWPALTRLLVRHSSFLDDESSLGPHSPTWAGVAHVALADIYILV
ncbi:uncharacterized protein BXZ73DRAFT_108319 [Epithele typhae]|uniref:uncharacterized protein n=1 Tax=Epithele typhae TaxID=378194 RepID=UPI0020075398|nr:uncharacterized protein BXZ73DRAFT_108319 [Epithele typhae]KAH9910998.1 hypothetical protein BXZ73DRAFT_108319 [Epithele typhae]